jgi:hypothetical protein
MINRELERKRIAMAVAEDTVLFKICTKACVSPINYKPSVFDKLRIYVSARYCLCLLAVRRWIAGKIAATVFEDQ